MPVDMKEMIAQSAAKLLFDKRVKKLTVKDIVEECHITRQAFYYHFSDIPDLLSWTLQQKENHVMSAYREFADTEERIKYLFLIAVNAKPYIQKGMRSNYGAEIERILSDRVEDLFSQIAEKESAYAGLDDFERALLIRYHANAVVGLLRGWTDEDSANIDRIVHEVYLIVSGRLAV